MAAAPSQRQSISKAKIPEHNVESALLQARKQELQSKAIEARYEGAVLHKATFTRQNLCNACHSASNLILQTAIP